MAMSMAAAQAAGLDIIRQVFIISRHGSRCMGSLIRATAMWGYPELVRELGGDPNAFLARFHIPAGAEHQEDAFISFDALTRMLEASADELQCPDFGLRLSHLSVVEDPRK
jgi:Arabinose-binding domain of AraC transcription regulator, N-term